MAVNIAYFASGSIINRLVYEASDAALAQALYYFINMVYSIYFNRVIISRLY
jgi:hypothetical protein